ncbi:hypothetical protein [Thermococcus sp. GR6]|uniref:hypothetical protein n=1 Tax=Thermococcus sp. GR6 TaxID=1638256 RepID=UPI00142FEFAA|nr:hypothetical protein [Thermococcus sp. GR6]NJE41842.1 hypothetical protein [Thermococcus sp. GR6]
MSTIRKLLIAVILLLLLLYFAVDIKVIYVSEAEKVKRIHIKNDSVCFELLTPRSGMPLLFEKASDNRYVATLEFTSSSNISVLPLKFDFVVDNEEIVEKRQLDNNTYYYKVKIYVSEDVMKKINNDVRLISVSYDTSYVTIMLADNIITESDTEDSVMRLVFEEFVTPAQTLYKATFSVIVTDTQMSVTSSDINIVNYNVVITQINETAFNATITIYTDESILSMNNRTIVITVNNNDFNFIVNTSEINTDSTVDNVSDSSDSFTYRVLAQRYTRFADFTFDSVLLADASSQIAFVNFLENRVDEFSLKVEFFEADAQIVDVIQTATSYIVVATAQTNAIYLVKLDYNYNVIDAKSIVISELSIITADSVAVTVDDTLSRIYVAVKVKESVLTVYLLEVDADSLTVINKVKVDYNKITADVSDVNYISASDFDDISNLAILYMNNKIVTATAVRSRVSTIASDENDIFIIYTRFTDSLDAEFVVMKDVKNNQLDVDKLNLELARYNSTHFKLLIKNNDYAVENIKTEGNIHSINFDTTAMYEYYTCDEFDVREESHKFINYAIIMSMSAIFADNDDKRTMYIINFTTIDSTALQSIDTSTAVISDINKDTFTYYALINDATSTVVATAIAEIYAHYDVEYLVDDTTNTYIYTDSDDSNKYYILTNAQSVSYNIIYFFENSTVYDWSAYFINTEYLQYDTYHNTDSTFAVVSDFIVSERDVFATLRSV